jgi:FixJ family two-component response regulator
MLAKALSGGIQHFVPKPYTAETLLKVLQKALTKQSTGKEETISEARGKTPSRE